jgi:polysaccharide pyruvyl transferase WcaK-like protein
MQAMVSSTRVFSPGFFRWENKGDSALTIAYFDWLQKVYDTDRVVCTSFSPRQDATRFGKQFLPMATRPLRKSHRLIAGAALRIPGARPLLTRIRFAWFALVEVLIRNWALLRTRRRWLADRCAPAHVVELATAIEQADLVVTAPGGYFTAPRYVDDWWLFHVPTLVLAKALGKKILLGPCSIGPFDPRHDRAARRALALADVVITRETESRDECVRLGVPPERIYESPDMAFLFARRDVIGRLPATLLPDDTVVVTVLRHSFPGNADPKAAQREYLSAMADALAHLHNRFGARVAIVPQTAFDVASEEQLATNLTARGIEFTHFRDDFTPDELKALYGSARLVVGTRLHGNILAIGAGTPVAAISYRPNTLGILHSMGFSDWYVDIENLGDGALTELVERQWVAAPSLAPTARRRALEQADAVVSVGIAARRALSEQAKSGRGTG